MMPGAWVQRNRVRTWHCRPGDQFLCVNPNLPGPPTHSVSQIAHTYHGVLQAHEARVDGPPHGGVSLGTPQGHSPLAVHNPAQGSEDLSAAQDGPGGTGRREGE